MSGLFHVRAGEWRRVGVFGSYIGLVVANIIVQYSFNDAAFLSSYPASYLPALFTVSALVTTAMSSLYGPISVRLPARRLSWALPASFAVATLLCQLLLAARAPDALFFVYVFLLGCNGLVVVAGWNFVRNGFDTRQVKRLMPLLGAIAGGGAVLGGFVVRIAAAAIGAENLLFVSAATLLAAAGCALAAGPLVGVETAPAEPAEAFWKTAGAGFGLIRRNPLMLQITGMLVCAGMVRVLVDFQFKTALMNRFGRAEIAGFLGDYFAVAFGIELVFQVFLTGRFLKRFGLAASFAARAVVVSALAAVLLAAPGFWGVVAIKLVEDLLDRSLFQSGLSLALAPLPSRRGNLVRLTQDGIVQPLVVAATSLLLILFTGSISTAALNWLVLAAAAIGVLLALGVNRHYLAELSHAVKGHIFDYDQDVPLGRTMDEKSVACLAGQLRSGAPDEVLFTLRLIGATGVVSLRGDVERLLGHEDRQLRLAAVDALVDLAGKTSGPALRARLNAERDPPVVARLLRGLVRIEDSAAVELAGRLVEDGDVEVMSEALLLLFRAGGADGIIVSAEKLAALKAGGPRERQALAGIIGRLKVEHLDRTLVDLVRDPSPEVQRSALEAARAAPSPRVLAEVCRLLSSPHLASAAEEVLASSGVDGVVALEAHLQGRTPAAVACRAARIFGGAPRTECLPHLEGWLDSESGALRYEALRALWSFRRSGIEPSGGRTEAILRRELSLGLALKLAPAPENSLLHRELKAGFGQCVERVLLILGLRHDLAGIESAGAGIGGGDPRLRANALEYLDNLLASPLEKFFLTLLEEIPGKKQLEKTCRTLDLDLAGAENPCAPAVQDRWLALLADPGPAGEERVLLERASLLARQGLFREMRLSHLWHLASGCSEVRFAAGEVIFPDGVGEAAGYVIIEGAVVVESAQGEPLRLGRGGAVGLETLFAGNQGNGAACCSESTCCLRVGRREVEELIREHAAAARAVVNALLRDFIAASSRESRLRRGSFGGQAL